jgi:hypothetical protein
MKHFSDEDVRVDRVWCGESTGTKLAARHTLSGLTAERVIGFEDESIHRRQLVADLSQLFSARYPAGDFVWEHLWNGPGKGASLCLRHVPTGIAIDRVLGYDPVTRYQREMLIELFGNLREQNRD